METLKLFRSDQAGRRLRPRRGPARSARLQPLLRARAARAAARGLIVPGAPTGACRPRSAGTGSPPPSAPSAARARAAPPAPRPRGSRARPLPPTSFGESVRNSSSSTPAATTDASSVGPPSSSSERTPWRAEASAIPATRSRSSPGIRSTVSSAGTGRRLAVGVGQHDDARVRVLKQRRIDRAAPSSASAVTASGTGSEAQLRRGARGARRSARSGRSARSRSCAGPPSRRRPGCAGRGTARGRRRSRSLGAARESVARPSARGDHVRDHVRDAPAARAPTGRRSP